MSTRSGCGQPFLFVNGAPRDSLLTVCLARRVDPLTGQGLQRPAPVTGWSPLAVRQTRPCRHLGAFVRVEGTPRRTRSRKPGFIRQRLQHGGEGGLLRARPWRVG